MSMFGVFFWGEISVLCVLFGFLLGVLFFVVFFWCVPFVDLVCWGCYCGVFFCGGVLFGVLFLGSVNWGVFFLMGSFAVFFLFSEFFCVVLLGCSFLLWF